MVAVCVKALVELTRADMIHRGDVGAAGRVRGDVLSVAALAILSQALFFSGDLSESPDRAARCRKT